ncbi:hypothetical protein BLA29_013622, partial [Euroglyphus maynei]
MTQTAIVLHTIMTIATLIRLAKQTEVLNKAQYYLVPIIQSINCIRISNEQQQMNRYKTSIDYNSLHLKLKIEDKFERLTWGIKYGPFVTNLGTITYGFIVN